MFVQGVFTIPSISPSSSACMINNKNTIFTLPGILQRLVHVIPIKYARFGITVSSVIKGLYLACYTFPVKLPYRHESRFGRISMW